MRTFALKTSLCVLADVTAEAISKVTFIYICVTYNQQMDK